MSVISPEELYLDQLDEFAEELYEELGHDMYQACIDVAFAGGPMTIKVEVTIDDATDEVIDVTRTDE